MIHLKDNIFCTSSALSKARSSKHSCTAVARTLMYGILNDERVLDCTLQGRRIYSQGPRRQQEPVRALNNTAREVIKCKCERLFPPNFSIQSVSSFLISITFVLFFRVC